MELTTPEKTSFQQVNQLLKRQIQRAKFQQESTAQLHQKSQRQRTSQLVQRCQFWIFIKLINSEFERRYDNFSFELLPLDL
ncbi:hypothetical protein ACOIWV_004589, partial [Vibrio parahaemolyticus]